MEGCESHTSAAAGKADTAKKCNRAFCARVRDLLVGPVARDDESARLLVAILKGFAIRAKPGSWPACSVNDGKFSRVRLDPSHWASGRRTVSRAHMRCAVSERACWACWGNDVKDPRGQFQGPRASKHECLLDTILRKDLCNAEQQHILYVYHNAGPKDRLDGIYCSKFFFLLCTSDGFHVH